MKALERAIKEIEDIMDKKYVCDREGEKESISFISLYVYFHSKFQALTFQKS
jgi:hypothetical protein